MNTFIRLFPLWAIILATFAYFFPFLFTPLKAGIVPLLMIIMFGMGITLTLKDFLRVLQRPAVIALGVVLQYTLMPLAAWVIGHSLGLSSALIVGMVLVGSTPGGTASNVICYLARGNVALSVTLTMSSTLLAFLLTPVLTWVYVGQSVPVPVEKMLWNIVFVALVPVLLGALINTLLGGLIKKWLRIFPLISILSIILIIAVIVALNTAQLATTGLLILTAVILHNLFGLMSGYLIPRMLGYDSVTCRTLAIEVGMQNSGLSVQLAMKYFSAFAALPGALFSIWHNISGSLLASYWRSR